MSQIRWDIIRLTPQGGPPGQMILPHIELVDQLPEGQDSLDYITENYIHDDVDLTRYVIIDRFIPSRLIIFEVRFERTLERLGDNYDQVKGTRVDGR